MRLEKETSVFKRNALATAITNALGRATKFIAEMANGIFVHAEGTPDEPDDPDAAGVYITDQVDIIRNGTSVASYSDTARIGSEAEGEYNLETTSNAINYKVGEIPIIKNIATFTPDSSALGYSYYQNMMATSNGRSYVMYGSAPDADNDNPTGTKTANATIGVNGGTNHEALVYCGSDAYNGNPAIIASINGVGRLIVTEQNAYLYNSSSNTTTTVDQNGNIQTAGQIVPCVLPWTFSNQSVGANVRGTISNLPISGLPSGAQIRGVVVTKTPNNHWVRAYAYAQDNTKITINYVNEHTSAITGAFTVLIFFTL